MPTNDQLSPQNENVRMVQSRNVRFPSGPRGQRIRVFGPPARQNDLRDQAQKGRETRLSRQKNTEYLERKPQRQLNDSRIGGGGDLAELAAIDVRARSASRIRTLVIVDDVGIQEVGTIEGIKKLRAELDLHAFGNCRDLRECNVEVDVSGAAQVIARQGAVGCQRRVCHDLGI